MRYYDIEGKKYPSVTTVLSATKTKATTEALDKWKDRIGSDVAENKFQDACKRGTASHKLCEDYLLGNELNFSYEPVLPYWESLKPVLGEIKDVFATEQKVHHDRLAYAGTLDAYATFRGVENTLIDFKTADKPKNPAWIGDYFIQTTAYSAAVKSLFDVTTNQTAVIIGIPNQKAQVFVLDREMMFMYWELWLERLDKFNKLDVQLNRQVS